MGQLRATGDDNYQKYIPYVGHEVMSAHRVGPLCALGSFAMTPEVRSLIAD